MRKLTLDLEALKVESFEANPHGEERGTVVGRRLEEGLSELTCSCPTGCDANTCGPTCAGRDSCTYNCSCRALCVSYFGGVCG